MRREAVKIGMAVMTDGFVLSAWPDCSRPDDPDTISAHVVRAARVLEMGQADPHGIRHLTATEMLSAGVGVPDMAEALAHADGGRLARKA
jgi:integrase